VSWNLTDRRPTERLWLVHGEGWAEYSKRSPRRYHKVALLAGFEDGQYWARRVPYRVGSVSEALDYVRPAAVNRAMEAGRPVLRQGDIWFVAARVEDFSALQGTRHDLDGRTVRHPEHGVLALPSDQKWRAYASKDTTRSQAVSARYD